MTNLQLLNVIVAALFLIVLAVHFAKKQGRDPARWLFISLFLGGGGALILLFLLRRFEKWRAQQNKAVSPVSKAAPIFTPSEVHLKRWYYINAEHRQMGPLEFTDLAKVFKEKQCSEESLVWSEGMSEWKKAEEIPELKHEMSR